MNVVNSKPKQVFLQKREPTPIRLTTEDKVSAVVHLFMLGLCGIYGSPIYTSWADASLFGKAWKVVSTPLSINGLYHLASNSKTNLAAAVKGAKADPANAAKSSALTLFNLAAGVTLTAMNFGLITI